MSKITISFDESESKEIHREANFAKERPDEFVSRAVRNEVAARGANRREIERHEAEMFEVAREISRSMGEGDSNENASKYTELAERVYNQMPRKKN